MFSEINGTTFSNLFEQIMLRICINEYTNEPLDYSIDDQAENGSGTGSSSFVSIVVSEKQEVF